MPETYKPRYSLPELNAVPNKRLIKKLPKLPFGGWKLVDEEKSYWSVYTGRSFCATYETDKKTLSFPFVKLPISASPSKPLVKYLGKGREWYRR